MTILVTGSAGFIGYHLCARLIAQGHTVIGVDNLNDYYDPALKAARNDLHTHSRYLFNELDITDFDAFLALVTRTMPDAIIHLAAQAGVRHSLANPWAYQESNVLGTINVLEAAHQCNIRRVLIASSSSVYGMNVKIPFNETDQTDTPVSIYAATKKSGELIAHSYHHLYGIEIACLRFFTVYGPWYRPDMALFSFARNILQNKPIPVFNHGRMKRDFTYVDDVVSGILSALTKATLTYEIYNIGCDNPVELGDVITLLEKSLGKKAIIEYLPMQQGDVEVTYADIHKAHIDLGFAPAVHIEEGIPLFCQWFLDNQDFLLTLNERK